MTLMSIVFLNLTLQRSVYIYIYIYIYIYGVMDVLIANGQGNRSSIPGPGYLYFT